MFSTFKRKDVFCLALLCSIYVLALLALSCNTSPLYPNLLGIDSAIFSLLGKGLVNGKELFTDLFDHKGPIIFFINALGHLLGGRNGIFFLQCLSGFVTIVFLYAIGKHLRPKQTKWFILEMVTLFALGLSTFFYTFECGNLTEEYSMPFIAGCCYCFIKYTDRAKDTPNHPAVYAFFYGISIAILSLIRLNNAVTVCAGVLFIFIYLCYRKQGKNLLFNLLAGVAGLMVVFVPTFLYFYFHNALDDMIYATFLHNFIVATNTGHDAISFSKLFITLYCPMILSAVFLAKDVIRNRKISALDCLMGCILVANIGCLIIANRFIHYFAIFCPVYLIFLFRHIRISYKSLPLIAAVLCAGLHLLPTAQRTLSQAQLVYVQHNPRYTTVAADMQKIPENERHSVIGFELMAQDYLAGDILPCYKYYTLQQTWAITNPHIVDDFVEWVDTNEPLWILVAVDIEQPNLSTVLDEKYVLSHENAYITYYRLR